MITEANTEAGSLALPLSRPEFAKVLAAAIGSGDPALAALADRINAVWCEAAKSRRAFALHVPSGF